MRHGSLSPRRHAGSRVGKFLDSFGCGSLGGYGAVRDVAEIEARG